MNVISLKLNLIGCNIMPNNAFRLQNGNWPHQFLDQIAGLESNVGGYGAVNKRSNDLGRYQMSDKALRDANMKNTTGQWTGKFGVYSDQDFLKNKEAQEQAMDWYMTKNAKSMKNHKSYSYIGQEFDGIKERVKISEAGLLAAGHRQGVGEVKNFLTYLKNNNMKSGSNYPKDKEEKFKSIETRIRQFKDTNHRK